MTVVEVIRSAAARHAARPALVEHLGDGAAVPARTVTYGELYHDVLRLCSALDRTGVRPGDRLAVLLDNSVEMVTTEWACLLAGYLWVSLNTRSSAEEIETILADADPTVLVVSQGYTGSLADIRLPSACRTVVVGGARDGWAGLLADGASEEPRRTPAAADPVRIRYTSGTAGKPKGAVLPRRSYDASIAQVASVIGPLNAEDTLVQVAPMTHASGAMWLPHAAVGARAVLVRRFDVACLIDVVERYAGTAIFLVPTMLVRLLEQLDDPSRLASLRTIVYGGASMPVGRLVAGLDLLGPVFVQIYGLTESTWPVCALLREDHVRRNGESEETWRARLASCGRPTSVGRLRIVDEHGADVANGALGELLVRGSNTMSGYWHGRNADEGKGLDAEGWMHTGDVGCRDGEGYVTIVDRLHDMIVSGGFNVYPREVEDALSTHAAVLECAVVGRPSEEWGETVHACVVLKPGKSATASDLIAHCGRHLAGYKKPRSLEIVDRLPRNPSGKILRRALRPKPAPPS